MTAMARPEHIIVGIPGQSAELEFTSSREAEAWRVTNHMHIVGHSRRALPPGPTLQNPAGYTALDISIVDVYTCIPEDEWVRQQTSAPLREWAARYQYRYGPGRTPWCSGGETQLDNTAWQSACEKARLLFMDTLTGPEKQEVVALQTVTVQTSRGLFRIFINGDQDGPPPSSNVVHNCASYCLVISSDVPERHPRYDHYLMQLLLIRADPSRFLANAFIRG